MAEMLTVQELAEEVKFHDDTIRNAIHLRELPAFKFGDHYRIRREDADSWIERHRLGPENGQKPVPLRRGSSDPYALGKVAS